MGQVAIAGRNASVDAVNALLNGGTLEIRTGSAAAVDSAPTGTVLAIFTLLNPCFGAAVSGNATANLPVDVTASSTGVAGHYVAKDSGGNVERNGAVGVDMTLNNTSFTVGDNVSITSWSFSQPSS